jgi:hypothetical protein
VIAEAKALTDAALDAATPGDINLAATTAPTRDLLKQLSGLDPLGIDLAAFARTSASSLAGPDNDLGALLRDFVAAQAEQEVRVFIGNQELRGMVRTEVGESQRATARQVRAGVDR